MSKSKPQDILDLCIHTNSTNSKRIRRHDEICKLIANNVSKKYVIFSEPEIETKGGKRKPDMVIKDYEKIYIIDVTVRYENNDSLMKAYKKKCKKYKDTAKTLRQKLNAMESSVI